VGVAPVNEPSRDAAAVHLLEPLGASSGVRRDTGRRQAAACVALLYTDGERATIRPRDSLLTIWYRVLTRRSFG
jgi:hypothetical protein